MGLAVNRRLDCCTPFHAAGAWRHARACPSRPHLKLEPEELATLRAGQAPITNAGVSELRRTAPMSLHTWLSHPVGCRCHPCRYVEAHLDDG